MSALKVKDHVVLVDENKPAALPARLAARRLRGPDAITTEYGTVVSRGERGTVLVKTSSGRTRQLRTDDPRLRRATVVEELLQGRQFPRLWWD